MLISDFRLPFLSLLLGAYAMGFACSSPVGGMLSEWPFTITTTIIIITTTHIHPRPSRGVAPLLTASSSNATLQGQWQHRHQQGE